MSDGVAEQTVTEDAAPAGAFTLALGDKQEALRVKAHAFARDVIRPVASEYDRAQEFPWPVIERAAQQGLYQWELYAQLTMDPTGLSLPILMEELFWGCAGIGLSIVMPALALAAIRQAATDEQLIRWAPECFGTPGDLRLAALAVTEPSAARSNTPTDRCPSSRPRRSPCAPASRRSRRWAAGATSRTSPSRSGTATQASEARRHERMLGQVNEIVHGLFDSPEVRVAVCQAVRTTSQADMALLYEPAENSDGLRCTTHAGFDPGDGELLAGSHTAAFRAFDSGRSKLLTADIEAQVGSPELWVAAGRPSSILYEPLVKGDTVLGVLVVGWPDNVRAPGSRATVLALLAHEAAAAITRADAMEHLADEALTDSLTGLPNRRAWDAHLKRAVTEHDQWAIAMLDFDHFKQYNDTYGHPAGDRLLKETAAAGAIGCAAATSSPGSGERSSDCCWSTAIAAAPKR